MTKTELQEVLKGLKATEKYISSKFFYDDSGSKIFQEIMEMPEYYLTNSEHEILATQALEIIRDFDFNQEFNIVELGAGDGSKTYELLKSVLESNKKVTYVPIDISGEAMDQLMNHLNTALPELKITPKVGDYFQVLEGRLDVESNPSVLLFLGSNIGNYSSEKAIALLRLFASNMRQGDCLLLGADLRKNPNTIRNAYFDPHGITRRFNLNLLTRLNVELEANFMLDKFDFYCEYNPINGEVRSYLVSLEAQQVRIAGTLIEFGKHELIWTELSKKYTLPELEAMAGIVGLQVKQHFIDSKGYFTTSLWVK